MKNPPSIDSKKTVKIAVSASEQEPDHVKGETDPSFSSSAVDSKIDISADHKYKKGKITLHQGYDYTGEKSEIGIILALKNERFANKVVFTTFIDKMKNYVLTSFSEAKDMMPILESLKDPKTDIKSKQPIELTDDETKSDVLRWMKLEEVKLHVNV